MVATLKDKYIIKISCGSHHTIALTGKLTSFKLTNFIENSEIYSWGANDKGQCGIGKK